MPQKSRCSSAAKSRFTSRGSNRSSSVTRRRSSAFHDRRRGERGARPGAVHRGRHAAGRGRLGRPAVRARGRARDRPPHGGLPAGGRQVDGAGRHRRQGARGDCLGTCAPRQADRIQRGIQPGVSEGRRGGRGFHAAGPHRDRRRRRARDADHARDLRADPAQSRAHDRHGYPRRPNSPNTRPMRCSRRAFRS